MTDEDNQTMDAHGITCKPKNVYHYKEFKYDRLADAVRFAKIDSGQPRPQGDHS